MGRRKRYPSTERAVFFFLAVAEMSAQEKISKHVTFCCLKNDEEKIKTVTLSLYQGHILETSQNFDG